MGPSEYRKYRPGQVVYGEFGDIGGTAPAHETLYRGQYDCGLSGNRGSDVDRRGQFIGIRSYYGPSPFPADYQSNMYYGYLWFDPNSTEGVIALQTIPNKGMVIPEDPYFPSSHNIKGIVYHDLDFDCVQDPGEPGISGVTVKTTDGQYVAVTGPDGTYHLSVPDGSASYEYGPKPLSTSLISPQPECPAGGRHTTSTSGNNQVYSGNNFGLQSPPCAIPFANLTTSRLRRCFLNQQTINYGNNGGVFATDFTLKVVVPEDVVPISSTPAWTSKSGDTLTYVLGDLAPGANGSISLVDSVSCADISILGETRCYKATVSSNNLCSDVGTWDNSEIALKGDCWGSTYRVLISNEGVGGQLDSTEIRVYVDSTLAGKFNIKLPAGDTITALIPLSGSEVRIEADQHVDHPYLTTALLGFEGCGKIGTDNIQKGGLSQFAWTEGLTSDSRCTPIIGSYDPNDKQVSPKGWDAAGSVEPGTTLNYTVRFQNTGSDTAFFVLVADTIDTDLDLSTLQVLGASHDYILEVKEDGGQSILEFNFYNIELPDSTTDLLGSQGFVTFSIDPNTTTLGTEITNEAGIYFDFNPPIITNTVTTTLAVRPDESGGAGSNVYVVLRPLAVDQAQLIEEGLQLYPNPTVGRVVVDNPGGAVDYQILSAMGVPQKSGILPAGQSSVSLDELPAGIYLLQLNTGEKPVTRRIVKR